MSRLCTGGIVGVVGLALISTLFLSACTEAPRSPIGISGDVDRGRLLLRQYGCGSCHVIPGVAAAGGKVGPPLEGIASRSYLAGILPNYPANMILWIQDPQRVDPRTAMPDLDVSDQHARDMTAYLYTLR